MLRRRINNDFRYLLLAALVLAAGYATLRCWGPLPSGHGWGLALGIVGMTMMVGAQSLYTWRKHRIHHPPGALYYWLRAHVAFGFLGGLCALLHGGGRFAGIAGVAAALTAAILVSGFVGRYLYTALDRNTDDWQRNHQALHARVQALSQTLGQQAATVPALLRELDDMATPSQGWRLLLTRWWSPWRQTRQIRMRIAKHTECPMHIRTELNNLFQLKYTLRLEWESLLVLRRLFAWWYLAHVPLSWIMMTLATIHIVGVMRYWVK